MNALENLVSQIIIQSEYGPDIVIDQPFSGNPTTSGSSILMGILKPQVTIVTGLGNEVVAPWGNPGPTRWAFVEIAVLVALGIGAVLFVKSLK